MTNFSQYLNDYQPCDPREEIIVGVLCEGLQLKASLANCADVDRQRRRLEFQYKKWRSQLITQVFFPLPALSRPRREVLRQYREDYDSLCNEVAAAFAQKILTDFDPELVQQGKTLTAKLTIWINSKLRLKWRILDLVTPQKKTKEIRLLEFIVNLVRRSPDGFTKEEFLAETKTNTKFEPQFATEFLLDLLPRFWSTAPEGDRYFFDGDRLQTYLDQLCNQVYVTSLDPAIADQLPDLASIPQIHTSPSLPEKIAQLLVKYRANLKEICVKNNPNCHCILLLENYFKEQLYQVEINEEAIVRLIGVKRPTYQSHLERKCLPAFWELAIYHSPVSQPNNQNGNIILKDYIEKDPKVLLKKCYYIDKNQREYLACNAQNLSQKKLTFFVDKPEKWKYLALFYYLTVDTLTRFWKMKCLFLLSLLVFELEAEHTDVPEID